MTRLVQCRKSQWHRFHPECEACPECEPEVVPEFWAIVPSGGVVVCEVLVNGQWVPKDEYEASRTRSEDET